MIIGIDPGAADYEAAEHVAHTLPDVLGLDPAQRETLVVSTHMIGGDVKRDAIAITLSDSGLVDGEDPRVWLRAVAAALPADTAMVATWDGSPDAFLSGPGPSLAAAWGAVAQAATRSAGRLVNYPGRGSLRGRFPLAEVTARSAIEDLDVVGSAAAPEPDAMFDSRDYVRPVWRHGRVVLLLQPSPGGAFAPFEIEDPPRCCEAH